MRPETRGDGIRSGRKVRNHGPDRASVAWAASVALLLAAVGCNVVGGHPEMNQPCDAQNGDGNWTALDFDATVELPEYCPLRLDAPGHTQLLDATLAYPTDSLEPFDHATARVLNRENDEKLFSQVMPEEDPDQDLYLADYFGSWDAGTGNPGVGQDRDTLTFDHIVDITTPFGSPTSVSGGVDLPYSEIPDVDATGPSTASSFSIVEVDASTLNGKFPITYIWYDNGEKVDSVTVSSHANTLTVTGLENGTHVFEVVVKDADGDTGSETHTVEVS